MVDDENGTRLDRARAIGLFRYQLIRQAAEAGLGMRERGQMVRALAATEHVDPFGRRVRVSRASLDRWIRAWRAGGFEALVPSARQSANRTDAEVLQVAEALKRENPARTAAQVARILRASAGWSPSQSTLLRHFHRVGLQLPDAAGTSVEVFGRFEATRPNELWTGDALHGPKIAGKKTYLFAFIDDHSRLIVGHRWGFAEDTVRLAAALRPALASRGVPETVYVDNGSAFVDSWLLRACAKLGIRLTHSTPGRPQGRGKIERFFRTVNDQFLVEITPESTGPGSGLQADPVAGLLELNRLFGGWLEQVYHRAWHSETGQSPLARWHAGWAEHPAALPGPAALREAFLWEARRNVTKNATVSLQSNTYQVEQSLIGRRVELVFDPFDLTHIEVRYQNRPMGIAVPHTITRHSHPKARPETDQPPPTPTGINYLGIIAAAHQDTLAAAVNYAALTTGPDPTPADPTPADPTPADPMFQADLAAFTTYGPDPADADATGQGPDPSTAPEDPALAAELAAFAAYHRPHDTTATGHDGPDPAQQIPGQLDLTDLLSHHDEHETDRDIHNGEEEQQ